MTPQEYAGYSVKIRANITQFIEKKIKSNRDNNIYLDTFTKKEVLEGIGLSETNEAFDSAWRYLTTCRAEFMSYDKELKAWIWL